jgi:predicted GIY-YIG superfamily endonuclease
MATRKYYVYVIELDKEFALTKRAREANPKQNLKKPCIYVGHTSKTPEERFQEHKKGVRNSRGPLFSRVVYRYGKCLIPKEYRKFNPIDTREEALEMERKLTDKYRKQGYTVWSN